MSHALSATRRTLVAVTLMALLLAAALLTLSAPGHHVLGGQTWNKQHSTPTAGQTWNKHQRVLAGQTWNKHGGGQTWN